MNLGERPKPVMLENVQEMGDGIQVYPSFQTDVKDLEYKDLMMRVSTCLLQTQVSLVGDDGRKSHGPHVTCTHRLCVSITGLSKGGFTLKTGILLPIRS